MDSSYSIFSFEGFVSSNRSSNFPPYCLAKKSLRRAALACPMWRYPEGSGGNRVTTFPWVAPGRGMSKEPWSPRDLLALVFFASKVSVALAKGGRDERCANQRARLKSLADFICFLKIPREFRAPQRAISARVKECPSMKDLKARCSLSLVKAPERVL